MADASALIKLSRLFRLTPSSGNNNIVRIHHTKNLETQRFYVCGNTAETLMASKASVYTRRCLLVAAAPNPPLKRRASPPILKPLARLLFFKFCRLTGRGKKYLRGRRVWKFLRVTCADVRRRFVKNPFDFCASRAGRIISLARAVSEKIIFLPLVQNVQGKFYRHKPCHKKYFIVDGAKNVGKNPSA